VLFLAMIFLVLLAVLAVTASSTSIMQERMTGGLRNRQLGLMGAESTLRGGEAFLWNLAFNVRQPLPPCVASSAANDCVYLPTRSGTLAPKVQAFRTSRDWLDPATDGARAYASSLTGLTGSAVTANLAAQPRYIVEYLGVGTQPFRTGGSVLAQGTTSRVGEHHIYRITARSQGGTNAVVRVAESYFSAMNLTNTNFNPGAPTAP
jgi:type IV pilus assembly protein PilX